jgi:hypothetical protein
MAILNIDAYPCSWPLGWDRTPAHKRRESRYKTNFAKARNDIVKQLYLMGAREVIVSTNVALRRDGLPYASGPEPQDPAVAVYWAEGHEPQMRHRVIACDQWLRVKENLRAVGVAIEALRQLKRCGSTQVIDKVFTGFLALAADTKRRSWRDVFGLHADWVPATLDELSIDRRYRELARLRHPDRGGSVESMVELNRAHEEALNELHVQAAQ